MNKRRLVNCKVLITFVCSMFSLLGLSTILSNVDVNDKKDTKKTKLLTASVNKLGKATEKTVKVDTIDNYSKNEILTKSVIEEVPTEEVKEEPVEVQKEEKKVENVNPEPVVTQPSVVVTGTLSDYQQYAYSQFGNFGWSDEDFNNLVQLWNRESGWNPNAHSRSGAHGIPQALPASKMAEYGDDYLTNYVTQINWGLNYISKKYGNPTTAWQHMSSRGWY